MSNSLQEALDQLVKTASDIQQQVNVVARENRRLKDRYGNQKKLTARDVARIRELASANWKQVDIADAFDINPATVSRIVRHKYWA
ncbi:helix-turn-helix domain-containing protein [Amycolatopsis anabasis]|uniref:helix-turn-helix domain-containing protein n=1 Tax=Amycolatopsis anabasis TaxID=1840409 RepID=UPI00131EC8E4|nr:helix-turn-helix domain-containing protein [Amycolatopsis anabasis]